jgi:hypothetical protein
LLLIDIVKLNIAVWFGLVRFSKMKTANLTKPRGLVRFSKMKTANLTKPRGLDEKLSVRFKLNAVSVWIGSTCGFTFGLVRI